jgi:hypothetical protein
MKVSIHKSENKTKKYVMKFYENDGKYIKSTNFGASGYSDYTIHHDDDRKERYISRHSGEDWTDATKAGTLSRFILWNKKTITDSFKDYLKRFGLKKN